jgi:Crinkler effector protein N-terminal domain
MATPRMASSSSTNISLLYQIIDDQKNLLGNPASVNMASNTCIDDLKRQIFKDNKHQMKARYVDAPNLILWKLAIPLYIGNTRRLNMVFFESIKQINFPDLGSDEAFEENAPVPLLDPGTKLYNYWPEDRHDMCLHLVVQVPRTS